MDLLKWFRSKPAQEKRQISFETGLASGLVLEPTASGITWTPERGLSVSAYHAGVRHIAEAIASLPLRVMEIQDDGGKLPCPEHPLHQIVSHTPNSYMTSATWLDWTMTQTLVYGNSYNKLIFNGAGRVQEILPLHALYVQVAWDLGLRRLTYHVMASPYTEAEVLSHEEVLHLSGISLDGLCGLNPSEFSRDSLSLSIALDKFGGSFFANASRPSGVLKTAGVLSDKAKTNLKESWRKAYSGSGQTGQVPVLEEGIDFVAHTFSNDEAQFLTSKEHQVREAARWLKISPTKLADMSRATWSNIESENQSFITSTLAPWLLKLEQEFTRKMLSESEQGKYCFDFDVRGLLRGDSKTRYANYASAIQNGWLTVEEVRVMEGLPPEPEIGELRHPLNLGTGQDGAADDEPADESDEPGAPQEGQDGPEEEEPTGEKDAD